MATKMGISCLLYICILSVCTRSVLSEHHGEHGHTHGHGRQSVYIEIFDGFKEKYNVTTDNIGIDILETILNDFSGKFHCDQTAQDNGCGRTRCFDATQIASVFNATVTGVTEEILYDVSTVMLAAVSDLNTTCGQNVVVTTEAAQNMTEHLKMMFMSENGTGLQVAPIQEFLTGLMLESAHHNDEDGHGMGEGHGMEGHGTEEGHAHDHAHDLIKPQCLGADTLFDQHGLDTEATVGLGHLGHLASLIVLHILNDSKVSSECRILPRPNFFVKNTFAKYNAVDMTITKAAFAEIIEAVVKGGESHGDEHAGHDHHNHRRRRRDAHGDEHGDGHGDEHGHDELFHNHAWESMCLVADQYLAIFEVTGNITEQKFSEMTPALVQQKLSGNCGTAEKKTTKKEKPTVAERYGYGSLCTAIICLTAIFAIFFIRCQNSAMYKHFLELFIGLAVGTLFTDSLFHLIPVAFGIHAHDHSEDEHDHGSEGITVESYLWHALSVCGGLYLFYLVEKLMSLFGAQNIDELERDRKYHIPNSLETTEKNMMESKQSNMNSSMNDDTGSEDRMMGKLKGVSSVVVMIIFGDAIHNFADGLALGAAFTTSTTLGISTSIAIFCHELPHELGDFAVLLKGGLSYCKALIWNMVSALTAMLGLYVGLLVSTDESVTAWILGPTAGLFIYISLVDMMPLMVRPPLRANFTAFVLNNIGLLTGAGIMFLLSVFEHDIKI